MQTGRKIALLRERAGLTQEEFAEKLFVSRELISKWETGRRLPAHSMTEAMAELLGVPADELLADRSAVLTELSACIPDDDARTEAEWAAVLNAFLQTLSVTDRCIFIARYYHRKSSLETAWELHIGQGQVRKRLVQIRRRFADFIKETEA